MHGYLQAIVEVRHVGLCVYLADSTIKCLDISVNIVLFSTILISIMAYICVIDVGLSNLRMCMMVSKTKVLKELWGRLETWLKLLCLCWWILLNPCLVYASCLIPFSKYFEKSYREYFKFVQVVVDWLIVWPHLAITAVWLLPVFWNCHRFSSPAMIVMTYNVDC